MIALYKGIGAISRTIRWFNWGPYSHASWIRRDESCIEAWHRGGVRHTGHWALDHQFGTALDFFVIDGLTSGEEEGIEEFLLSQVGKGYDFRGITRFVSRLPPQRDMDQVQRWFCSVLVFAAVARVRRPLLARVEPHKVHPTLLSYSPDLINVRSEVITKEVVYEYDTPIGQSVFSVA